MVPLIFAIIVTPFLIVKYYETFRYRDKLPAKDVLFLVLVTIVVIAIFLEKVFKILV